MWDRTECLSRSGVKNELRGYKTGQQRRLKAYIFPRVLAMWILRHKDWLLQELLYLFCTLSQFLLPGNVHSELIQAVQVPVQSLSPALAGAVVTVPEKHLQGLWLFPAPRQSPDGA
jgi:hypothetical protein